MTKVKKSILLVAATLLLGGNSAPAQAQDGGFQVVVNSSNPTDSLSRREVSKLLLKKNTRWDDGRGVLPVDQVEDRTIRRRFSKRIHGRGVSAIKSYWQKQIFSGRSTPPPELASDREVLAYVGRTPGAIGYVSAGASLGSNVKALRVS